MRRFMFTRRDRALQAWAIRLGKRAQGSFCMYGGCKLRTMSVQWDETIRNKVRHLSPRHGLPARRSLIIALGAEVT